VLALMVPTIELGFGLLLLIGLITNTAAAAVAILFAVFTALGVVEWTVESQEVV